MGTGQAWGNSGASQPPSASALLALSDAAVVVFGNRAAGSHDSTEHLSAGGRGPARPCALLWAAPGGGPQHPPLQPLIFLAFPARHQKVSVLRAGPCVSFTSPQPAHSWCLIISQNKQMKTQTNELHDSFHPFHPPFCRSPQSTTMCQGPC
jgi:hypothetical protein